MKARDALRENRDIESVSQTVELQARHSLVRDTDRGAAIESKIADLHALLRAYQTGHIKPQQKNYCTSPSSGRGARPTKKKKKNG